MSKLILMVLACLTLIQVSASELPCDPPCANGNCVADHGTLSCNCSLNWSGAGCDEFICSGGEVVCENGGTCLPDPLDSTNFYCACPPDVLGERCQHRPFADVCSNRNCSGAGRCVGTANGDWECVCDEGHFGPSCEYEGGDPCASPAANHCHGHGVCTYTRITNSPGIGFNCTCDFGYEVVFECEFLTVNVCKTTEVVEGHLPCRNGGTCTPIPNNYTCDCPPSYRGRNCTEEFDVCEGACQNGGNCSAIAGGHYFACSCPTGFTGYRCDVPVAPEPTEPPAPLEECMNGGTQIATSTGTTCMCPTGYSGQSCEVVDVCSTAPCSNHTQFPHCVPSNTSGYVCICQDGWDGQHCDLDRTQCPITSAVPPCPLAICAGLAGNGQCDEACNTASCGFDAAECFTSAYDPWGACPQKARCGAHFLDRVCNVECNSAECLFDGGDCSPALPTCEGVGVCSAGVEDGRCDPNCNTPQCPYDGVDCSLSTTDLADGTLVLVLYADRDMPFTSPWREDFVANLSRLLNSIPVLEKVEELSAEEVEELGLTPPTGRQLVYRVEMRLDVSQCSGRCVTSAEEAVRLIEAARATGHPNLGPYTVASAYVAPSPTEPPSNNGRDVVLGVVGGGVVLVILAVLLVAVLIGKRKRVTAKIWRPNSPSDSSPGEVGRGTTPTATAVTPTGDPVLDKESEDYFERCAKKSRMTTSGQVTWEDVTDGSGAVIGQRGHDHRQWTVAHRNDVGKLVQQYKRVNGSTLNIDTPGPGGFTPLMLVVMRRPGTITRLNYQSRSSSESSSDDQTALIPNAAQRGTPRHMMVPPVDSTVSALLEAKANLDAVNDYNQTALHLAASCSRPEYVDQLVEAGANPNIQDNWGQTPLHAAIGAGAEGAFMVLVNCPRTKINVKSDGGITPLMSAVKMVNGFMVKQLLKKDAEIISSTDDDGRTAVHWAAMVDNIEALRMLVKCGSETIKDAQDSKGQTPLFLACREGSVMCVKHLLDCFANVTLLDSLEQSPMHIAMQKQHADIVEMLRTSAHGPLYMRPGPHNSFLPEPSTYSPGHHPLVTPPISKKKKSKTTASSNHHFHPFRNQGQGSFQATPSSHMPMSELQTSHAHSMAMSDMQTSHAHSMAMSDMQTSHAHSMAMSELQHSTSSTVTQATPTASYSHQQSSPNYPPAPTPGPAPGPGASHSPPLQQLYTPTSNPAHYSITTPTTSSGFSDPSPGSYDPHQMMGEEPTQSSVSSSLQHSSAVLDNYPLYNPTETRPLQHLPVVSEADIQTSYASTHHTMGEYGQAGAGSPPQSGNSVSQRSPPSAFHAGPSPNSTSYGASPQSLTPSPESQHPTIAVGTLHGTVQVEPGYGYPHHHHNIHQPHFMGTTISSTPV